MQTETRKYKCDVCEKEVEFGTVWASRRPVGWIGVSVWRGVGAEEPESYESHDFCCEECMGKFFNRGAAE